MPRTRVWAREQKMSKSVLATCLPWMRAVLLVSCVLRFFSPLLPMEGRDLARAVEICRLPCLVGLCLHGRWGCKRGRLAPGIIVGRKEGDGTSQSSW
jgi:hypothetical protein